MNNIIDFDNSLKKLNEGQLSLDRAIDLCQDLVDSGQLWRCSNETNIQVNNFIDSGYVYRR